MALIIDSSGLTTISSAESTSNWTGPTMDTEDEILKEGSNSLSSIVRNDNTEEYFNVSNQDYSNQHLRLWVSTGVYGLFDPSGKTGLRFFVNDGSNDAYWNIADKSTYQGGWINIVVNTASPDTGSATMTSIDDIGIIFGLTGSAKRVVNTYVDYLRYGDGYICYGTSWDFSDVVSADVAGGFGIVSLYEGSYFLAGALQIGRSSEATTISESGSVFTFIDAPVSSSLYKIQLVGHASSIFDFAGCVFTAAGPQSFVLDFDDTGIADLSFVGNTIQKASSISFRESSTACDVTGNTFDSCGTISTNGCTFENNTITSSGIVTIPDGGSCVGNFFNKPSGTTGVNCVSLNDLDDCSHVSDGTGHAVILTRAIASSTAMSWGGIDTGYASSDGSTGNETILVDVNSGITLTINVQSGASTPTIMNTGSGTVDVVSGLVTLTLIGLPNGIEVRIRQGSYTIQHTQDVTDNQVNYSYTYVPNKKVTISFSGAGIIQSKTIDIVLPATSQSSLITFEKDPSYQEAPRLNVVFTGVGNIVDTDPHTITMTFNGEPKPSTVILANISQEAEDNGTISNLGVTGDSKVWEFDFTSDGAVADNTNFFRANTSILDTNDRAINESDSANFEIDVLVTIPDAIHKWDMDGDSLDSGTTGGYDGTDTSMTYSTTDAKFTQAGQFNGTGFINHGFTSAANDEQAISFYIVINAEDTSPQFLLGLGGEVGLWTHEYNSSGASNMYFVCRNSDVSTDYSSRSTNSFTTGQIYHIGMNYKNGNFEPELYVNGALQDNRHDNISVGTIGTYFGARGSYTAQMTGALDHVEIFDRHLTATEWQTLSDRTSV